MGLVEEKGDDIVVEGSDYTYDEVKEVESEHHEQETVGELEFVEEKGDDIVVEGSDFSYDEVEEVQSEKSLIDSILEDTDDVSYYSENCKIVSKLANKKKKIKNFA